MGYTGHAIYTTNGETNSYNEWKHDNTEDAMRFAEAIQLARGGDVSLKYCDLAEGYIYGCIHFDAYDFKEVEEVKSLHCMTFLLGDAMERDYDYKILYDKENKNYRVKYFMEDKSRPFNFCSLDNKLFKEVTDALVKANGHDAKYYKEMAKDEGISLPKEEAIKVFRPVVKEMLNSIDQSYPFVANSKKSLELVNAIRTELDKGNKVFMCGRASAYGKKNIVLRINENGKNSIKTFPYDVKDMTTYSMCLSGEWAGNYEKINKKEDANLLLQANRLVGKTKYIYSSMAKKVAKDLQEGKEASFEIGGGY